METKAKRWRVRDKVRFLTAMMDELAGDAHVSFEGDLRRLNFSTLAGVSDQPSSVLKRNTIWPKQDFIIVPLEPSMGTRVIAALGGVIPRAIIHIQIEKSGRLEFGAYDNFHPECIFFGSAVREAVIERLASQEIIRPDKGHRKS